MKLKKINGKFVAVILAVPLLALSTASHAYIPDATVLDPMFAELTTDIQTVSDKSYEIMFLVTGLLIGMGLIKKFSRKAAS